MLLQRALRRAGAQQHLLEFDQVLQDAPVPVPRNPARITEVAAIPLGEAQRMLAPPTATHRSADKHQVALARGQRQAVPVDQVQRVVLPHQQVAGVQIGVAQAQCGGFVLQRTTQCFSTLVKFGDARPLLLPQRQECTAGSILRLRQRCGLLQPRTHRIDRRGFKPQRRQCLAQRWRNPGLMQAPQHLAQPAPLRAAQRCLEARLPFDIGEQRELQAPTLHRCTTGQCRPRRNDLFNAQRATQPMQAVPDRWRNLIVAALQPPVVVAGIDAEDACVGVGTHRTRHHRRRVDVVGLLQDFNDLLRRSE
ncbi:hypothetical protein D3C71_1234060 [compost metagenome]